MELTLKRGDFLNELTLMQGVVEKKYDSDPLEHPASRRGWTSRIHLDRPRPDAALPGRGESGPAGQRDGSRAQLFDLIRNLPEADVNLKLMENHYLGVTCQRSSFRLVAQPAEDFPTVPKVEAKRVFRFRWISGND